MEGSLSLSGPLSSIFPNMFQMNGNGKENGSGSGVTPPHSTDRCVRLNLLVYEVLSYQCMRA